MKTYYLLQSGEMDRYLHKIDENLSLLELLKRVPTCLHSVIQDYEFNKLEVWFDCVRYKIEVNS